MFIFIWLSISLGVCGQPASFVQTEGEFRYLPQSHSILSCGPPATLADTRCSRNVVSQLSQGDLSPPRGVVL